MPKRKKKEVVETAVPTAPTAPAAVEPKKEEDAEDPELDKENAGGIEDQVKEIAERREDDEDIQKLRDIIDTLLAQKAFDEGEEKEDPFAEKNEDGNPDELETMKGDEDPEEEEKLDSEDDEDANCDGEFDDPVPGENTDLKTLNTDSIDRIVRERVKVSLIGSKINLDGLEDMDLKSAKKAVIRAVRPGIRLDGKSTAFVNALYACCADDINERTTKDTQYQRKQMFNKDSGEALRPKKLESTSARERMVEAMRNNKKED